MSDIGDLPVTLLIAAYLTASFLRGPNWLRTSIAIPMGMVAAWTLAFGLHINVPASVGRPLNKIVPAIALLILLAGLVIEFSRKRTERRDTRTS